MSWATTQLVGCQQGEARGVGGGDVACAAQMSFDACLPDIRSKGMVDAKLQKAFSSSDAMDTV